MFAAPEEVFLHAARRAGVECVSLNESTPLPGSAVVLIRPRDGGRVDETIGVLRNAADFGVPVIVVAGSRDQEGEVLLHEAGLCGVPNECVLFVHDGKVVDANGTAIADALRGKGIGIRAVILAAERAVKENLVPEPALWEDSPAEEELLWEAGQEMESMVSPKSPVQSEQPAPRENIPEQVQPPLSAVEKFISACSGAEKMVAVFGVKSGVGATTVAACLAGVLSDYRALHLEASPSPTGYVYYGPSPLQAVSEGMYAYFDGEKVVGEIRRAGILVADVSMQNLMDAAYERAGCVVIVTDGSPVSFRKVQSLIQGGWRCDVLVVNRFVPGAGYPPEVYAGEFGLQHVVGVPGGLDEETAVNHAQHSGTIPIGKSVDMDTSINELAAAVLEILEGGCR